MHDAYLAIGSNLGDRQATLQTALARLNQIPRTKLLAAADFISTAPVDAPAQSPEFLNSAAHLATTLGPRELLDHLLAIERDLGRNRDPECRNAPRPIDLDLLLFGSQVVCEPGLCIPHPRMHKRQFVLEPLVAIAPEAIHPVLHKNVRELLAELGANPLINPKNEIVELPSTASTRGDQ